MGAWSAPGRPGHYDADMLGHVLDNGVASGAAGPTLDTSRYVVSSDAAHILLAVNRTKRWRHSFEAEYLLLDVATLEVRSLSGPSISYAAFLSTTSVVFVEANNIKLIKDFTASLEAVALTTDGSANVFNGIPDWLYEEEILSSNSAVVRSQVPGDTSTFCFFAYDNTGVPAFEFPLYAILKLWHRSPFFFKMARKQNRPKHASNPE